MCPHFKDDLILLYIYPILTVPNSDDEFIHAPSYIYLCVLHPKAKKCVIILFVVCNSVLHWLHFIKSYEMLPSEKATRPTACRPVCIPWRHQKFRQRLNVESRDV